VGDFRRSLSVSGISWPLFALVIAAAVPLLLFGSTNVLLQRTISDDHAEMGHYGFMTAISLTVILAGLLATLRPVGWRFVAWVAGALPVLLGLTSLVYPNAESNLGNDWSLISMAWGAAFVVVAERIWRQSPVAAPEPAGTELARPGAPTPWPAILGIVAVAAALLLAVLHLTGGGFAPAIHGGH